MTNESYHTTETQGSKGTVAAGDGRETTRFAAAPAGVHESPLSAAEGGSIPPGPSTGRLGDDASMAEHIAQHETPTPHRRRSRRDTDDGGGFAFRDKAQRLSRWHRQNTG